MSDQDKGKTAFTTPKGLYQFNMMPSGASATLREKGEGV